MMCLCGQPCKEQKGSEIMHMKCTTQIVEENGVSVIKRTVVITRSSWKWLWFIVVDLLLAIIILSVWGRPI